MLYVIQVLTWTKLAKDVNDSLIFISNYSCVVLDKNFSWLNADISTLAAEHSTLLLKRNLLAGTLVLLKQPFVMLSQSLFTGNSADSWTLSCAGLKSVSPTFWLNLVSLTLWSEN
jgi:hypothetical protein